jgi:threonine dehydratase
MLIPLRAVQVAQKRIRQFLPPTPLIYSHYFSQKTGCDVWFKLEILQPTHAFKVRGAFNAILQVTENSNIRNFVTASGGNHGLGVALACKTLGLKCTIFLPASTPLVKVNAIKRLGADVVLHGASWDEANDLAMDAARMSDLAYIHAFNDEAVMAGQGTIMLEIYNQLEKAPDTVVCSMGGGGLISGNVSVAHELSPNTRFIGVETLGADCISASLRANALTGIPAITSVAESLGACKTTERQLEIISRYVHETALVTDEEAITVLLELLAHEKLLVEPAASCSLAALTCGKFVAHPKETIVIILCGGNISLDRICQWQAQYSSN